MVLTCISLEYLLLAPPHGCFYFVLVTGFLSCHDTTENSAGIWIIEMVGFRRFGMDSDLQGSTLDNLRHEEYHGRQ